MEVINQEKLEEIHEKIDDIFEKENLSMFEIKVILQDMLNRDEWVEQEERFDKLIKKLKN